MYARYPPKITLYDYLINGDQFLTDPNYIYYLFENGYLSVDQDSAYLIYSLAEQGEKALIEKIYNLKSYEFAFLRREFSSSVAKSGNIELMQWTRAEPRRLPWGPETCYSAAGAGQLEMLIWLRANGCQWNELTCAYAAGIGRRDIIEWAITQDPPACLDVGSSEAAALAGNFELLIWLDQRGCGLNGTVFDYAVQSGNLEMVKWLHFRSCQLGGRPIARAAGNGDLAMLNLLKRIGVRIIGSSATGSAAKGGHLAVLEWLIENGVSIDSDTYKEAAEEGQVEVLEWLYRRDPGRIISPMVYINGIKHPKVVIWLRDKGVNLPGGLRFVSENHLRYETEFFGGFIIDLFLDEY